jgi:hypothetical protein
LAGSGIRYLYRTVSLFTVCIRTQVRDGEFILQTVIKLNVSYLKLALLANTERISQYFRKVFTNRTKSRTF